MKSFNAIKLQVILWRKKSSVCTKYTQQHSFATIDQRVPRLTEGKKTVIPSKPLVYFAA